MAFNNRSVTAEHVEDDIFSNEEKIAGLAIFITASTGLLFNIIVVFIISRLPSMQNPFGKLLQNQAIGDLISCFVFTFYFAPMVFFNLKSFKSPAVSQWFSHVQLMCYDSGNVTHLFASLNRLTAIFCPILYSKHFTIRFAHVLNAISWLGTVLPGTILYIFGNCTLIYDEAVWNYQFSSMSNYCMTVGWYYDFVKSVFTIVLILSIDMVTYVKCRTISKKLTKSMSSYNTQRRHKDEANFVKQAFLQGLVFGMEMLTYFYLATYVEARLGKFLLTTLAWVLVPTLDGVIVCLFNKELKRWFVKKTGGKTSSVGHPTGETRVCSNSHLEKVSQH